MSILFISHVSFSGSVVTVPMYAVLSYSSDCELSWCWWCWWCRRLRGRSRPALAGTGVDEVTRPLGALVVVISGGLSSIDVRRPLDLLAAGAAEPPPDRCSSIDVRKLLLLGARRVDDTTELPERCRLPERVSTAAVSTVRGCGSCRLVVSRIR